MEENKDFDLMPYFMWKVKDIRSTFRLKSPIFTVGDVKFHMLFQQNDGLMTLSMIPEVDNEQSTVPLYSVETTISVVNSGGSFEDFLFVKKKTNNNNTGRKECHLVWGMRTDIVNSFDVVLKENGEDYVKFLCVFGSLSQYQKDEKDFETSCSEFQCMESLAEDLDKLRSLEDSSFKLKCGDKSLNVHKIILSARSEIFADMFRNEKLAEKEIEIKDMEFEVLENLIAYIYSGRLKDNKPSVYLLMKLYKSAVVYKVESLKVMAYSRLIEILNNTELPSDPEILDKEKLSGDPEILDKEKLSGDPAILDKEKLSIDLTILDKKKHSSDPATSDKERLADVSLKVLLMACQNNDESLKNLIILSIVRNNSFILKEQMWKEFRIVNPLLSMEVYDRMTNE